jgi:hypothetical protein
MQANITLLAALLDAKVLGAEPLVYADRLNHESRDPGLHCRRGATETNSPQRSLASRGTASAGHCIGPPTLNYHGIRVQHGWRLCGHIPPHGAGRAIRRIW